MTFSKTSRAVAVLSAWVLSLAMMTSSASALDATLSVVAGGATTCNLANVTGTCRLELDVKLRNPDLDGIIGLGMSVLLRDSVGAILDFGDGATLISSTEGVAVLFSFSNFISLSNAAPFISNDANSGKDVLRTFNGAVANPVTPAEGDGLFETPTGGNGGQNQVIIDLLGSASLAAGDYTLELGFAFGDGILPGTVPANLVGTIAFTVPEPGVLAGQLAALGVVVGIVVLRRRRSEQRVAA